MATTIRNLDPIVIRQILAEMNKGRLDEMKIKAGLLFHADVSAAVTTAVASDLPTSIALANALKAAYNVHVASACSATTGQGCHIAADATNPCVTANATILSDLITLLNALKGNYNAHRVLAASHATADATNVSAATNASDLATSITLANDLKTQINAHFAAGMQSNALVLGSA